jgi:hypothetical protein
VRSLSLVLCLLLSSSFAQQLTQRTGGITPAPGKPANQHPTYRELRAIRVGGEAVAVSNLVLKRDVAIFTFTSGTFSFLQPVNGKVTGAVFIGNGTLKIEPVLPVERAVMGLIAKNGYEEQFSSLVLRFTDGTAAEIKKAATGSSAPTGDGELQDIKGRLQNTLHYNLDGRILNDVLGTPEKGIFWAFIKGKNHGDKQMFQIDPHGATGFAFYGRAYELSGFVPQRMGPAEVLYQTYSDTTNGIWLCEHFASEYASGAASGTEPNELLDATKHVIVAQIDRAGKLTGSDALTVSALEGGIATVSLDLFHKLRVQSVTGQDGKPLDFIQEGEKDDWGLFVVLPRPLQSGEEYSLLLTYAGKGAVSNSGGGNYDVEARDNWYPNTYFGDYADYELTFMAPKKMKIAGTGTLVREADEGDFSVSEWKSAAPIPVAGFTMGRFKVQTAKLEKEGYVVDGYANEDQPDWVKQVRRSASGADDLTGGIDRYKGDEAALGTMSTIPLLKRNVAEAQLAMQLYTAYFGKASIDQLAVTQQTPCNFGQAWPGLVYLPVCAFFDSTVRNELGLTDLRGYWQVVGPHEVAHQWWGHTVGWDSYSDQWMSEGFAELSASLFLQQFYKDKFKQFWHDEVLLLTERNANGFRGIDVPLTLGYRLANTRTGASIPRRLIYPKGGYILHMVRMMMYDRQHGDKPFQTLMQDFVNTYRNKPASTEDFKRMVEKHMTPVMDLDHNKKMDWFFNQYVYGTELPKYTFEHSIAPAGDGQYKLHFKITQSGVSDGFKMLAPVYLELANGTEVKLGAAPIVGNHSMEQDVTLPLKEAPKRATFNANFDVLAEPQ